MKPFAILKMAKAGGPLTSTRVQLISTAVSGFNAASGNGSATAAFNATGLFAPSWNPSGSANPSGGFTWKTTGAVADYDIKATLVSGDAPTGTLDAWLNLASNRSWALSASNDTSKACTLAVQIRDASTLAVICGPVNFSLDATGGTS